MTKQSRRDVFKKAAVVAAVGTGASLWTKTLQSSEPLFPRHKPIGRGRGLHPGRVVWAHDPKAVLWNGKGRWWRPEHFDEAAVRTMFERSLLALSGKASASEAWKALFSAHRRERGLEGSWRPGEKIAVKVNMNGSAAYSNDHRGETDESYGNAVLMRALLASLVEDLGARPGDVTFYDAGRIFPEWLMERVAGREYRGVLFRHRDPGGPLDAVPDTRERIRWAGPVRGDASYIPRCVTEADYLINLANLKGHYYGLTLCGKNHFGSFVNSDRMRAPQAAGLHGNVANARPGAYSVLVDLAAHRHLGGKTVLFMLDALLTAPGESVPLTDEAARWTMPPFGGGYCASLFLSQDGVAIDSVGADFLSNEPNILENCPALPGKVGAENYLHEAAEAGHPRSGTRYTNGAGETVSSLGVHDHWDNPVEKRYGINLGLGEGIELVRVQ